MPASFLETQNIKMPFTEYMSMVERTSMKSLLRRAAEQLSENKVKRLVDDYKAKVNNDKHLLNQIEELPVISDNPAPVVKEVNIEQEILENQPLILRESAINQAITADVKGFCSNCFDLSEPEKYQEILALIDEGLAKEGQDVFDISTKENLILGLANRYAQNAIDARTLEKWKEYNFYMRSLAYFIPLLLERANSKSLDNKVEKLEVDFKVMSKVKKLISSEEVEAAPKDGYIETREGEKLSNIKLPKGKWCYYISKNGTKYAVHNVGGKLRAFKVPSQQEVALIPDMKAKISVIAADVSYKELVEELNEQFEIVKKNLDRIKDRFKYRMLINVSYPLDRANKIEDDIYNELKKINKEVDKLWGKIG